MAITNPVPYLMDFIFSVIGNSKYLKDIII